MSEQYRALGWLTRRRAGESCAVIGARDGVSAYVVARATKAYGPFPRPTHQLGRRQLDDEVIDARGRLWLEARRRGVSTTAIAEREGVPHQVVSRVTKDHGPFPSEQTIEEWVESRRARVSVESLAQEYGVSAAKIRRLTAPHGPFRSRGPQIPDGVVGVCGIAELAGVSGPTATRWVRQGLPPDPDFVTATGRRVWFRRTIETWLQDPAWVTCPDCGAHCRSVGQHRGQAHRREEASGFEQR